MSEENDRAICCTCKNELELVRPGKHQCNVCEDRPILRHNGVGEADMYSPEEYERLMAGDEVPNQTDVLTNQTCQNPTILS